MSELTVVAYGPGEAREWWERTGKTAATLRLQLWEGYQHEAWKELGYADWTECLKAFADEFGYSEIRLWQLHAANKTEALLYNCIVGEIPEGQLRPLTSLPPALQTEVWQMAADTAPDGKITGAHVKQTRDEYLSYLDREANEAAPVIEMERRPHVANNSGENEWYTPPEYIEAARAVMGAIDLDPASSDIAQQTVKAERYYTAQDDGLLNPWNGRVWMNPPYSGDLIGKFIDKLHEEFTAGNVTEFIVLVNNATETGWFCKLATIADAVVFPKGRVKFIDKDGNLGAPLQGQAFVYGGDNAQDFLEEFSAFGWSATR